MLPKLPCRIAGIHSRPDPVYAFQLGSFISQERHFLSFSLNSQYLFKSSIYMVRKSTQQSSSFTSGWRMPGNNYRIIEVGRSFFRSSSLITLSKQDELEQVVQDCVQWVLNIFRYGDSASAGNLFQWLWETGDMNGIKTSSGCRWGKAFSAVESSGSKYKEQKLSSLHPERFSRLLGKALSSIVCSPSCHFLGHEIGLETLWGSFLLKLS